MHTMETNLKRTCLYDKHIALGAQLSPFGGFDMPIQYTSIIEEHNAVRHACGIFDVSHMGEVLISGPEAERLVGHLFTNDVREMPVGKVLYGMMLYPNGGVVDDLLVYKKGAEEFFLVINAANIDKDFAWMQENSKGFDAKVENLSDNYAEVAVQGPQAEALIEKHLHITVSDLEFYTFKELDIDGHHVIVSRTGYTGEDGFEIYSDDAYINKVWDILVGSKEVAPCGLGCRDTLRFEVALPLYGHELSDTVTPVEAGLGMFVKVDKGDFCGRDAIVSQKAEGVKRKVVGIELKDKAIPRAGYPVMAGGVAVGTVTTGYRSISTGKSLCMALVPAEYAALGTELEVEIRHKRFPGTVCRKRFYQTNYKK